MGGEKLYLGTWFPRTELHLQEFHSFLMEQRGPHGFVSETSSQLWSNLHAERVELHVEDTFDYLEASCGDISIQMTEDGILTISAPITFFTETRNHLENFFLEKLSPVFKYLFGLGAPLPKSLERIEELYPLFFMTGNFSPSQVEEIFTNAKDRINSSTRGNGLEIYFGKIVSVCNIHSSAIANSREAEQILQLLIFFREFEDQLHRYLRLHRTIWEETSRTRDSEKIMSKDFPKIRAHLLESGKMLSFVHARIEQMQDILVARKALTSPKIRKKLLDMGQDSFEQLESQRKYMSHLWDMTQNYIDSTFKLLNSLYEEHTQRELNALKFVTIIAAITGFFGMNIAFPWEERWLSVYESSLIVTGLIVAITFGIYMMFRFIYGRRRFRIAHEISTRSD